MSSENEAAAATAAPDAMADEWAAALAESKPDGATGAPTAVEQVAPVSFANLGPGGAPAPQAPPSGNGRRGRAAGQDRIARVASACPSPRRG